MNKLHIILETDPNGKTIPHIYLNDTELHTEGGLSIDLDMPYSPDHVRAVLTMDVERVEFRSSQITEHHTHGREQSVNLNLRSMWQDRTLGIPRLSPQLPLPPMNRMRSALDFAISVIQNYALDIRSRPDLVNTGFCQGIIYLEARQTIQRILDGKKGK